MWYCVLIRYQNLFSPCGLSSLELSSSVIQRFKMNLPITCNLVVICCWVRSWLLVVVKFTNFFEEVLFMCDYTVLAIVNREEGENKELNVGRKEEN